MKHKLLMALIANLLATGCALMPESKPPLAIKPAVDVRHGMKESMAQYQLGRMYQEQGRLDAAEIAYNKALIADPGNPDSLGALGVIYAKRGELERAAATFNRVIKASPGKAYLYNNIGYALYLNGHYTEAIEALRTALTLDANYDRAWVNLHKVALSAGMTQIASLARLRKLSPDIEEQTSPPSPPLQSEGQENEIALIESPLLAESADQLVTSKPSLTLTEIPYQQASSITTQVKSGEAVTVSPAISNYPSSGITVAEVSNSLATDAANEKPATITGRVEVSNANGVSRFATNLSKHLRNEGVKVTRIFNYLSFNVEQSVIEYQPGFAESARALGEWLGVQVALKNIPVDQQRGELRLILGKDSARHVATAGLPPIKSKAIYVAKSD